MNKWPKRKLWRALAALVLAAVFALNVVAFLHARAMSHFTEASERTLPPEKLSTVGKLRVLLTGVKIPKPANTRTPRDAGLEFETLTFPGAHGLTLEAWRIGCAESRGVVVIFHGYSMSKDTMLAAAKEFHTLGFETLLVDFHGSGGSSGRETSVGWHEAEDVAAAFEQVRKTAAGKPIILYAPSMGAVAILRAIHAHGVKASAIILECPFDSLLSTAGNRFRSMRLPAFPLAHLLVFWGGVQEGYNGFAHNPVEYARSVHCPALVMHGGRDPRVTVAQLQNIFTNLPAPKSLRLFPSLGHESYLAAQPDEWRATVKEFLANLDKSQPAKPN